MLPPKYEGERYKLWTGDSLKVLQTFPDECVHLIVTSPPYFVKSKPYTNLPDDLENLPTWEEYLAKLLAILTECARVLVAGGRLCINISDSWTNFRREGVNKCLPTHAHIIVHLTDNCGLEYKGSFIYYQMRNIHASGGGQYLKGTYPFPPNIPLVNFYEYILVFKKAGKRKDVSRERKQASKLGREELLWCSTGIWELEASKERSVCPFPFPPELPYRLIKLFSFVDDIVLDPFVGSGTTIYAALQLGRIGWGIDISEPYIDYVHYNLRQEGRNLFE